MSVMVRRAQPWLGTIVSIDVVVAGDPLHTTGALARAFAAIERVHVSMSRQRAGSDVARFNAARRGDAIECDRWTIQVLRLARWLQYASGGLFDVSLGRAVHAPYRVVDTHTVIKLADDCRIDLGGIAKGFAVDRAVAVLRACGIQRGLVNAGGDLRSFGPGAWPVAIRGGLGGIALERGAIATSQYRHGRSLFHDDALIAPASGAVHAIDRSITVAAPRCVLADALTKVVALSGSVDHPMLRDLGGRAWLQ